jgi:hypothetical protein
MHSQVRTRSINIKNMPTQQSQFNVANQLKSSKRIQHLHKIAANASLITPLLRGREFVGK